MKKVKLVVAEKFIGKRDIEDVLISAFQTELLKDTEIYIVLTLRKTQTMR